MNESFLFLIAIPLSFFLVILLFMTREFGASQEVLAEEHAPELAIALSKQDATETVAATAAHIVEPEHAVSVSPSDAAEAPASAVAKEILTKAKVEGTPLVTAAAVSDSLPVTPISSSQEPTTPPERPVDTEIQPTEKVSEVDAPAAAPALDAKTSSENSEIESLYPDEEEPILPEGPLEFPAKGSPKYTFDYRGRLWVEKKRKGFFRQLRRPQIPPDEPSSTSSH